MRKLHFAAFSLIFTLFLSSCIKDNFDAPDTNCLDQGAGITNFITVEELIAAFNFNSIDQDIYLKAVVSADDQSGNIYKKMYVQDATGAIAINVDVTNAYTKFPEGRTVYIKLNGLYLQNAELGMGPDGSYVTRIPALFVDDFIIRGACNPDDIVQPLVVDMSQLSGVPLGTLIQLNEVEFINGLDGLTFADAVGQTTQNRDVRDCNGNTITVRTSGFADFAGTELPTGNGSIIGIYSVFGTTKQLYIRRADDASSMTATRCDGTNPNQNVILSKTFEDQSITSGGWTLQSPIGSFSWNVGNQGSGQQGSYYAKMSNFSGSNSASEAWLISPSIDVSGEVNPVFKFINAYNYSGDPMQCLISTNYDGVSDPSSATWTSLNPVLSSGGWSWVSSGNIDLSLYQTGPFHIGFKYTGSNSSGSTWEVDAIQIIAD